MQAPFKAHFICISYSFRLTSLNIVLGSGYKEVDASTETEKAARDAYTSLKLKGLNERLYMHVTFPLEVPEVKQDQLKTPVKLDLLTRLSECLRELYSETQAMVAETCKYSEDLEGEFFDFAHHGLRAEHNDLVYRIIDLESTLAEMLEVEKEAYKRLLGYQANRQYVGESVKRSFLLGTLHTNFT